jgi:hypothetical protein
MVDTLDVCAARLKERHELALEALAAVEERGRADVEHTNLARADAVATHQPVQRCESH